MERRNAVIRALPSLVMVMVTVTVMTFTWRTVQSADGMTFCFDEHTKPQPLFASVNLSRCSRHVTSSLTPSPQRIELLIDECKDFQL